MCMIKSESRFRRECPTVSAQLDEYLKETGAKNLWVFEHANLSDIDICPIEIQMMGSTNRSEKLKLKAASVDRKIQIYPAED